MKLMKKGVATNTMNSRAVRFFVFLMLVSLLSFGSDAQVTSTSTRSARTANSSRARVRLAKLPPNALSTNIGFLAATQIAAGPAPYGSGTYSPYPGVVGDFDGDGNADVAALVNNGTLSVPVYAISAGRTVLLGRVFADGPETSFRLSAPLGTRKIVLDPNQTVLSRSR